MTNSTRTTFNKKPYIHTQLERVKLNLKKTIKFLSAKYTLNEFDSMNNNFNQ